MATWAPKMLPKWRPAQSQLDNCRPSQNMRRRDQIACPAPCGELQFRSFFRGRKIYPKICETNSITKHAPKRHTKGSPGGPKRMPKVSHDLQKSDSGSLLGNTLATKLPRWLPDVHGGQKIKMLCRCVLCFLCLFVVFLRSYS